MARRKPIIAGNWKMNNTIPESLALVDAMLPALQVFSGVERIVCPPFTSLPAVSARLRETEILVGAQNVGAESRGAFTGEIAAGMLEGLASYAIVGHSERRQLFCEDDALVNRKVKAALGAGLVPIVCLGETLEQHERGETHAVVTRQVRAALDGVDHVSAVVIAYEPIWAIGTGRPATPEGCNATLAVIRQTVAEIAGSAIADGLQLQYGGSVTPDNFAGFIAQPDVDGALVGGASLKADQFVAIARIAAQQD